MADIQDQAIKVVEDAFAALPATDEEVAAFFKVRNIRGSHAGSDCPMAKYVVGELEKAGLTGLTVNVARTHVTVAHSTTDSSGWPYYDWRVSWAQAGYRYNPDDRELPEAVPAFVRRFDRDDFPELDTDNDELQPAVVFEPVAA